MQNENVPSSIIDEENCSVVLIKNWLNTEEREELFSYLMDELCWEKQSLKIFGKTIAEPRMTYAMGDENTYHNYTGISRKLKEWNDKIFAIKERIVEEFGFDANGCLLNLYIDGDDYIGWHADKETSAPDHVVVTISLGGSRDFMFKRIKPKEKREKAITILLEAGDLCLMKGDTQKLWKHQIPKRKRQNDPRISLTFRKLIQS